MLGLYLADFYKNEKYPTLYLYNKKPSGGYFVHTSKNGAQCFESASIRLSNTETLILPLEFI